MATEACCLPIWWKEVATMETFFVRKQIFAGAILFACVEIGVLFIKALAR